MNLHKHARLTPRGRALLVERVVDHGLRVEEAAHAAGVSVRTAYKWLRRFREEGLAGLQDRSSRPHRSPSATPPAVVEQVVVLRRQRQTYRQISQALPVGLSTIADMLTTVQGVDGFAGTDARQIAIALISEDKTIRPQALDTRSYSRCTTMSSLLPVNIQIAISKDSAAHRTYAHRLILHAHLLDNLGNELMNYAMRTARAIVHRGIVHQRRLLIYQILW